MHKPVKNNVSWVGKVDWELRDFHGHELSTHRGTSYNSYLIKEEKVALVDTVWLPYAEEFVDNLAQEIPLDRIDYIIVNHGEIDHSGALPELMRHIPDKPIYCTANGIKSLRGHYHQDWNFHPVKTGDRLDLGNGKQLVFFEAPLLHWPDTMFTYLTGDNILFSNDAFGQHYATEELFNDRVDQAELYAEAMKYYANILTPFSGQVTKKINEFLGLKLPVAMICTSHGVIWRDHPEQIIEKYLAWANNYQENRVVIVYDTMWEGTRLLAEAIAEGIRESDPAVIIKLYNASKSDKNDIMTEIFRAKAVLFGSPTVNRAILHTIAGLLEMARGLAFKGKKAAAFGTYGWSGESVALINEGLQKAGFQVVDEGLKALWRPDSDSLRKAREFGAKFLG
ncbi:MAG TPA: anaerobic nitric oxide reductase flavorubredoxin [Firmicutes bacterium]|jgi:anaerobic nitric oxide reductase flavorubredoxin|nr:anaerobic nitric oxide reductase flavorubredoxin [Bacillota bacterium]HOQ23615.1 anaerobic nitric oxide reductase flavorubredoxin [Bacillota bacterium]HPT68059.1 anaerobic nitric oxide reductase flavorubredoxin [Bacillota bacterium]